MTKLPELQAEAREKYSVWVLSKLTDEEKEFVEDLVAYVYTEAVNATTDKVIGYYADCIEKDHVKKACEVAKKSLISTKD